MIRPTTRDLLITKISATVTLGICDVCNAQFRCYIPNPDQAKWELKTWFDGHICRRWGRRPLSPFELNREASNGEERKSAVAGNMTEQEQRELMELCVDIIAEKDPRKFDELVKAMNALMGKKEKRLGQPTD
jgi:hypothetical protein